MDDGRMRYGIYLPPMGPLGDPGALLDLAVRAETAGWDGVFLWDHVLTEWNPIADTWTALAGMAAVTRTIRLGPMVTPLPRRRPWVVTRQASTVSRLSGGRLIVGVGLGSDESGDFSRFGEQMELRVRSSMLDEGIEIMRVMWAGRADAHNGQHYRIDLPACEPQPHPLPLWIAGSTRHPRVIERAAASDGIFVMSDHTLRPDELGGVVGQLRRAGIRGNPHFDIVVAGNASTAWERPNPDNVDLPGMAEAGATWWMESLIYFDPLDLSLQVVDAGPPRS